MTETLHLDARRPADVERAAAIVRGGGLVAFATETVYGLGANALDAEAVARIFAAKDRPAWDPLIVHIAKIEALRDVVIIPAEYQSRVAGLMRRFWPGPLTLLLPRSAAIPDAVTAGRPLVGVRMPQHEAAQAFLRAAAVPVAAPSANRFGHVSPTQADHVFHDLDGRIHAVLDAGRSAVGVESTVLDPCATPMLVYRAGGVSLEEIGACCPEVPVVAYRPDSAPVPANQDVRAPESLPSPGVGIRHYAPAVPLELVEGTPKALQHRVEFLLEKGLRVGVLLPTDWELLWPENRAVISQGWGKWTEPEDLAIHLFHGLRCLEQAPIDFMVCPLPAPGGLREALRDRLSKAARSK